MNAKLQFPHKKAMSVLWYWETISYSVAKALPAGKWRTYSWKTVHQEMVGTGSALHKKVAGRPSVHADTAEMFRKIFVAFRRNPLVALAENRKFPIR
jgi:hypothetical protein